MIPGRDLEGRSAYRTLQLIVAVISVTALLSFIAIQRRPDPVYELGPDVSPYGYTASLVLFFLPASLLLVWFVRRRDVMPEHWSAFKATFTIIVVVWAALDVLLANTIFKFPNPEASLGVNLPGYDPVTGWGLNVPVEEFLFYISGSAIILLLYIWSAEVWYARYSRDSAAYKEFGDARLFLRKLFHKRSAFVGVGLVLGGIFAKAIGPTPGGLPVYFIFLVLVVITPTAMCFEAVVRFLNLRAFLFTIQSLLSVSILWEVTLGLPYGWWDYEHDRMLGWFITPWSELPIEAPLLWLVAAWSNVGIYEVAKIYYSVKDRKLRDVLFTKAAANGGLPHGDEGSRLT